MYVGTVSVTACVAPTVLYFHVFLQYDHNNYPKWDNSAYFTFSIFR